MSDLPVGWERVPIGALCELKNGRAFKPSEWSAEGRPIVRIQNLNNPTAPFNRFSGESSDRHALVGGELLFAWSGTPGTSFGAHIWKGGAAVLNQHIFRVDFDSAALDKRFFRHAINQKLSELIDVAHGGVGLRHVTKGVFEATAIEVPPLAEQKRIADKLDTLLARIDACRERLDRLPALIKRFRQAVLESATRAKSPKRELRTILQFARTGPFGSSLHKSDYVVGGIPIVNPMHIIDGHIRPSTGMTVSPATAQRLAEFRLAAGDIVIGRRGEMGRCAVVTETQAGWLCGTGSMVLRPARDVLPRFLQLILSRPSTVQSLEGGSVGSTMVNLNQGILLSLQVDCPDLAEQAKVIHQVEALFAYADSLEARFYRTQAAVAHMSPSLLAMAFLGELVAQNPADTPASKLLPLAPTAAPSSSKGRRRLPVSA